MVVVTHSVSLLASYVEGLPKANSGRIDSSAFWGNHAVDTYTPQGYYTHMLNEKQKEQVSNRLRRIEGQVGGIARMIEEDRYCVDILNQTAAVVSALRKVESIVMENHLNTCVADAMRSDDPEQQREKTAEVMDIIGKYRGTG
jgi:CsoR family transcriptional regulator, copper-sensing transcriptional repressor